MKNSTCNTPWPHRGGWPTKLIEIKHSSLMHFHIHIYKSYTYLELIQICFQCHSLNCLDFSVNNLYFIIGFKKYLTYIITKTKHEVQKEIAACKYLLES